MDLPASVHPPVRHAHLSLRMRSMLRRVSKSSQPNTPLSPPSPSLSPSLSQQSAHSDSSSSSAASLVPTNAENNNGINGVNDKLSIVTDIKPPKTTEPNPYSPDCFAQFESLFVQKNPQKAAEPEQPELDLLEPEIESAGQASPQSAYKNMSELVTGAQDNGADLPPPVMETNTESSMADEVSREDIRNAFSQLKMPPPEKTVESRPQTSQGESDRPQETPRYQARLETPQDQQRSQDGLRYQVRLERPEDRQQRSLARPPYQTRLQRPHDKQERPQNRPQEMQYRQERPQIRPQERQERPQAKPQELPRAKGPSPTTTTTVTPATTNWRVPSGIRGFKLREPLPAVPWDGRIRWAPTFNDTEDFFDEVRFRPKRTTKDTHRTVALLNLPPHTSILELSNVICGGKLVSLHLSPFNPGQHLATADSTCMGVAVFVLGIEARAFVNHAQCHPPRIRDTSIRAVLYTDAPTYPLSRQEDDDIFEHGHTRSLSVRGSPDADRRIVVEELVRTGIPKMYADAAAVVDGADPEKECVVHLNSIYAMTVAKDVLMRYGKRNKCWISNAPDPCDRPISA